MSQSLTTDKRVNKPTGGGAAAWGGITGTLSSQTDLQSALDGKAATSHSHIIADVTGLQTALDGKQAAGSYAAATHSHIISDVTGLQTALDGKAATSHTHTVSQITDLTASATELNYTDGVTSAIQTQLDGKAASSHTHTIANVTGLQTALDGKEPTITNGYGLSGTTTKAVALTSSAAFATAETTISAATYADITGCSVTLAAGTWIIFGHVVARNANAIIQVFVAITDSANTVIAESATSRPASGTASLNSPIACSWQAIVTPSGSTTYKLRGARGLTTHTGNWIAMDGNGVNTANHASNNTDKGTSIIAIRIG